MRKPFIIGVVVGIVLVMAASIAVTLPFSAPFDKACRDISVFDDISELSFLKLYETEKVDRLLPDGAKESYCANISYKGGSYTVTAFVFDSEDLAWRYMFDVSDESFPTTGTEYRTGFDMATDKAYVEVAHNGNYYRVDGDCSDGFIEFLQLMFSSMPTPVKEGLSNGAV
ncbi:unknown [Firmicutes bacterium CAG:555]|nr:unknown [Firmicutes bacterium CAG:555]